MIVQQGDVNGLRLPCSARREQVVSGGDDIKFRRKGSRVARLIGKNGENSTPTGHLGFLVHWPFFLIQPSEWRRWYRQP